MSDTPHVKMNHNVGDLTDFLTYKALHQRFQAGNQHLIEHFFNSTDENNRQEMDKLFNRQMCAKVTEGFYQDLEYVCNRLEISKRAFIERAVAHAMEEAQALIEKHIDSAEKSFDKKGE